MQRLNYILFLFLAVLLGIAACIDPFNPPEIELSERFLVYDGYIQANGQDTSWVTLSRTQNVHDPSVPAKEGGAVVSVENEQGEVYTFQAAAASPGTYYLPPAVFDVSQDHRLSLKLADGKTYLSEWQPFRVSPPIDSISYEVNGRDGIQIYVHTHDPAMQTRFYKWTFDETWEYSSPLISSLEMIDTVPVERTQDISRCWSSIVATNINVFTTAALSQDVVRYQPVTYVPAATNKLLREYSILVRQQALTREAYDYWTELARNNETNGSIFDPFPSGLSGNIKSAEGAGERVFGFFSGGVTQSQRVFIRENLGRSPTCYEVDTLSLKELRESYNLLISYELPDMPGNYVVAPPYCLDCRVQGGTTRKPDFWR